MKARFVAALASAAILAFATLTAAPPALAATPPAQFVGTGTTYWEYQGNDGNGNLLVTFNSNEPGLAANQADVTYSFDSGTQPFFVNSGQIVVTGSWATGWSATTASPASTVQIGPFGGGTNISFDVEGWLVVQNAGFAQGPWEVEGSFST